ncbi:MAG: type II toxin-antitoxin system VapC family toxin [Helicobacteraceae bacterium]|nr:type II toxin-antitoxin system VapC family toxin [Helicobacteraceae bacterium]
MKSVMLDTSFLILLLKEGEQFHSNCLDYWKYFLENNIDIYISTIAISEYSVKDDPYCLPLESMRILSFSFNDAALSGKIHNRLIAHIKSHDRKERNIVINDIKLLAQTVANNIDTLITGDKEFIKSVKDNIDVIDKIRTIDLSVPLRNYLGTLF